EEVAALERDVGRELDELVLYARKPGVVLEDDAADDALARPCGRRRVREDDVFTDDGREVAGEEEVRDRVRRDGEWGAAGQREALELLRAESLQLGLVRLEVLLRQPLREEFGEGVPRVLLLERLAQEVRDLEHG